MGEIVISGLGYVYDTFATACQTDYPLILDEDFPTEPNISQQTNGIITYPPIDLPKPLSRSQINFYNKGENYGYNIIVSGNFKDYNEVCLKLLKRHLLKSDLELICVKNTFHLARESIKEESESESEYTLINSKNPEDGEPVITLNSGVKGARVRMLEGYDYFEADVKEGLSIINGIIRPLLNNKDIPAHNLTYALTPI